MEKHAYALIKDLTDFIVYILHSHTIAYVPSNVVENILTQLDLEGKREKWIAILFEYDLEIKPTKLVKGQDLEKMSAQSNCDVLGVNFLVALSDDPAQGEMN